MFDGQTCRVLNYRDDYIRIGTEWHRVDYANNTITWMHPIDDNQNITYVILPEVEDFVTANCGFGIRDAGGNVTNIQNFDLETCNLLNQRNDYTRIGEVWHQIDYDNSRMTNMDTNQEYVIIPDIAPQPMETEPVAVPTAEAVGGGGSYHKYMKYKAKYERLRAGMQ